MANTLNAEAYLTNLKRSLEKYIYDNLYTSEGFNIHWQGMILEESGVTEWIRERIEFIDKDFYRQGSTTQYAHNNKVLLTFDIFIKKSSLTVTDRHYEIRDAIAEYFKIGKDIQFRDYISSSAFKLWIRVRDIEDDGPMPETNEYLQYRISFELHYVELTNNSGT